MNDVPVMVRRPLLSGLIYAVGACAFSWPLVLHLGSLLGAQDVAGDPSLNLWTLGWDLQTLSTHPSWLLSGRVFEANIYFPAHHTLAYSDHLLLQALILWPLYGLTHDLVLCYNVLLLASLVAAGLAMHVLARELTGSERAAYVAGLVFAFAPYHFTHLPHLQLQALYFLPLSFLFLHRFFAGDRRWDTLALGLVVGLQVLSSIYYGVIGALGLLLAAVVLAALRGRLRDWRLLKRGLLAVVVALVVCTPWSIPYLQVQNEAAAGRNLNEAEHGSAVLSSYLQAPDTSLLYGRTGWLQPSSWARLTRKEGPEQALFPGLCALFLGLFGSIAAPRGAKQTVLVYSSLAVAGLVLSLGPEGVRPLYSALHRGLFGMTAIRAPARFSVLTLCGIAVLAALGVRTVEIRAPRVSLALWAAILALLAGESVNVIVFPAAPALTTNAGRWLRDQPGTGAVVCVPMGLFVGNTACMLQSLEHGRAVLNGYSGIRPPFFEALVDAVSQVSAPHSLLALHELGVEYVVTDRPLTLDDGAGGALVLRASFSDQHVYQLQWSPAIETTLVSVTDPPPPEPGPASFEVGELAAYRVLWTNGPMRLPAGDATIGVVTPQGSERYRFAVSARTAPWVSRFYEADATLEATANPRLLPLTYRESILDGKRRLERRVTFDAARREVRIASGGTSIALPVAPDARDPISALFYIRTLPLSEGSRFTLPISDNGRRLRLEVVIDRLESIVVDGKAWSAWKIEPRLSERIERPDRLMMAAWVSSDPRHIPLVVEVSAPFGAVRVEMVSYRGR